MRIVANGTEHDLPEGSTARDLVALLTGKDVGEDGRTPTGEGLGVALARGGEIVPRGTWASTALAEGERFELVTAVQGG